VLSFAIIMLNTSLHNPSVKDKPTVDRFVAMNRGINEGGDLPRELLEVLTSLPCRPLIILTFIFKCLEISRFVLKILQSYKLFTQEK